MKGRKPADRAAAGLRSSPWPRLVDDGGAAIYASHEACVDAWLKRATKELPEEALLPLFQGALTGLWDRTKTTLGEVTLAAIAERVVQSASERFPLLSLEVEPSGAILCGHPRNEANVSDAELALGMRFVLVEFLTVLGNLTAQILTPELHAELSKVTSPDPDGKGKRS